MRPKAKGLELSEAKRQIATLMEQAKENDKALQYYSEAFDADDRTKHCLTQIRRLQDMNKLLEDQLKRAQKERDAAVKSAAYWKKETGRFAP